MRTLSSVLLALIVVAGCSSPSASAQVSAAASAQAGAVALVCANLVNLKASVDVLRSLDPATTSKDTYAAAIDGVVGTWKFLEQNLQVLGDANSTLVSTAWRNLNAALQAQPSDVPVATAFAAVKPEAEQFAAALKQVNTDLGCT